MRGDPGRHAQRLGVHAPERAVAAARDDEAGQGAVSRKRLRQREERGDSAAAQIGDFLGGSAGVRFALAYGKHDGRVALLGATRLAHAPAPHGAVRHARDQKAVAATVRVFGA